MQWKSAAGASILKGPITGEVKLSAGRLPEKPWDDPLFFYSEDGEAAACFSEMDQLSLGSGGPCQWTVISNVCLLRLQIKMEIV